MKAKLLAILVLVSGYAQAEVTCSTYKGKIKSLYVHNRDSTPYFGIELEGNMNVNGCGASTNLFIKSPDRVTNQEMSMLLAAHMAGKEVEISNADSTAEQLCHGVYPTFNMVRVN